MAKPVSANQPVATVGADAIYRSLFDSFNPDKDGRISPMEVLSRLERSGLRRRLHRRGRPGWTMPLPYGREPRAS